MFTEEDAARQHREAAPVQVRVAVLTASDTRSADEDRSGEAIRALLGIQGHHVADYRIVPDEPALIRPVLEGWIHDPAIDAIITNGGTGIAARDTTFEVIAGVIERPLPGFGELFRMLSWDQVGAAAMMSRATAGIAGTTAIFALPGSTKGVQLAMTKLILPELGHVMYELRK